MDPNELKIDKNELLWKVVEREIGASIPKYLKILLEHEAFNAFAVLAAMPVDIKEKLENTAKHDFGEFDEMQQVELLKKCRNSEIMTFKLREGDTIFLTLIKTSILKKGVTNLNELLLSEKKKRKRSMQKDVPAAEGSGGAMGDFATPEKKPLVPFDPYGVNADLEEYRRKIVRMTNGWIVNSFICTNKEVFFVNEEDIKFVVTNTSISTSIRCRICFHDIKILSDSSEGRPVKFIISNFSRHCKSHGMRNIVQHSYRYSDMEAVIPCPLPEEMQIKEEYVEPCVEQCDCG